MDKCKHTFNDGGRSNYFKGFSGDCVVRAITIASGSDYKSIYDDLYNLNHSYIDDHNNKLSRQMDFKNHKSPRNGNYKKIYHQYIIDMGFTWVPTMHIGQGCKVHLRTNEIPSGTLILKLSRHLTCVIDKVINDTYDPSRNGMRCVYGYYEKK